MAKVTTKKSNQVQSARQQSVQLAIKHKKLAVDKKV